MINNAHQAIGLMLIKHHHLKNTLPLFNPISYKPLTHVQFGCFLKCFKRYLFFFNQVEDKVL